MTMNHLVLSGTVRREPIRKVSPSGIPHCQFVLEHSSIQEEAGFTRQSLCRVPVVASGQQLHILTQSITVGSNIKVIGFLSNHKSQNGIPKLVLHAKQIEFINSGD